jgi:hypothetical protein
MILFYVLFQSGSVNAQQVIKKDSTELKALIDECQAAIQTEMKKTKTRDYPSQ